MGARDLRQRAAGAAGDVEEAHVGPRAVADDARYRRDHLPPHDVGGPREQQLDGEVVELGGAAAQIAVTLPVEVAPEVRRVALEVDVARQIVVVAGTHAAQDTREIDQERRQRARVARERDLVEQRSRVEALVDVGEIPCQQRFVAFAQRHDRCRIGRDRQLLRPCRPV